MGQACTQSCEASRLADSDTCPCLAGWAQELHVHAPVRRSDLGRGRNAAQGDPVQADQGGFSDAAGEDHGSAG